MEFMFGILGTIGIAIIGLLYFIPAAIARKKVDFKLIFALNLFLGWTIIGWIWALIWACQKDIEPLGYYKPGYPGYTLENALRLKELQKQFDAGVITKSNYDNGVKEILDNTKI
jgi:hypothetical protein